MTRTPRTIGKPPVVAATGAGVAVGMRSVGSAARNTSAARETDDGVGSPMPGKAARNIAVVTVAIGSLVGRAAAGMTIGVRVTGVACGRTVGATGTATGAVPTGQIGHFPAV